MERKKKFSLFQYLTLILLILTFLGRTEIAKAQVTVNSAVVQSSDDAEEEISSGSVNLTSSDLELTSDGGSNQWVGMRFQNITIPQGTVILSASIQFTVDETDSGSTSVQIWGHDADNSGTFTTTVNNISNRPRTTASVNWSTIPAWNTVGQAGTDQETPDLTSIVQEIVNRGGWASGNAMSFVISGSGERTAESYNGSSTQAPVLQIVANIPRDPLPTIVTNNNRALPFIYFMADNRSELYSVAPDPDASPLPVPTITNITYGGSPIVFSGEGGGFRSTDSQVYVFQGPEPTNSSDLYSIDPTTGVASLIKNNIVPGHVDGAEFWINNTTGEEMLVILYQNGTSGGADRIMAINPNASGTIPAWTEYSGYPVPLSGALTQADGISWNPDTAEFYVQNDNNVDYYTIDITTGVTTFDFTTSQGVDGEGITYAADGTNYIEDENNVGLGRTIFVVDTETGNLTPAAQLGSTGDVESIMGNLGSRNDAGDAPSSYGYAAHSLPVLTTTPVTIYLGAVDPDSENPFVNFSTGFSDDITGDDEDGVTSGGADLSGQILSRGQIKTLDIITNGAGVLNAWIDFNRDGDFDDLGEQIASDIVPSGGSITLNVLIPATASVGTSYARFRYSSDTGLGPGNSTASNGEVEDYQVVLKDEISCSPKFTLTEQIDYHSVHATSVIIDNSVGNENNALGNDDTTTATFNSSSDELVLEMGESINSGDAVTINGEDGDDFDIWVSPSAVGPWTQVGVNAQLDFTFNSPINWLYIRFMRGDGSGTEDLSYIEALKSTSTFICIPDNDEDGIPDRTDLDDDNDGIPDADELNTIINNNQPPCGGETALDFSATATLESGTPLSQGAVYRIANVAVGTDALITIVETFNATIPNIDNNTTEAASFKPQTSFNLPNIGDQAYVEYNIQFVTSGGSTPVVISKFFMNFNDIDGNANFGEQNWSDNPSNYTISNPSELTMTTDGSWVLGTAGTIDYPGSGNGNPQVNFSVNYNSKSEMSVRVGAVARVAGASATGRQHNIEFNCVTNYVNPVTYAMDNDSDGIANHLDLDADNDGIYDAVEANHLIMQTDGEISGPFGENGLSDLAETAPESGLINYTISNADGEDPPDYLDTDSDNDGCSDANEGYYNPNADAGDNEYYDTGNPPGTDAEGRVSSASYQVPADIDSNSIYDFREFDSPPSITIQPTDTTVCPGCTANFDVSASNTDKYQWQIWDGASWINVNDGGIYSGANSSSLTITPVSNAEDGNQYRVLLYNSIYICSEVISSTAILTVKVNTVITNRRITYRVSPN